MGDTLVVGPDLTPDWDKKFVNVRGELDKQLLVNRREPGKGLSLDELQIIVEHRYTSERLVVPADLEQVVALEKDKWGKVFRKGDLDFSDLVCFPRRAGHDWPVLVPKGTTNNRLYAACQAHFTCWPYTDNLDTIGPAQSFTTLRWFKKVQEADEALAKLSANHLLERAVPCVTLQERLWMEIHWFIETSSHLDEQNVTLVAGSRRPDGRVPSAHFHDGRFRVHAYDADYRPPYLRSRSEVSKSLLYFNVREAADILSSRWPFWKVLQFVFSNLK